MPYWWITRRNNSIFLVICELKESLKRLQLYQFNAGRRTLASGGCKRKELLRLLELIQEVKVFTKHFTDLLLKLSRWIVWLFLRRVSLMNGWPVSRWIFFVSKDRNIKNRFDWHCARVVAVAWQKKTAFTLAHICLDWIVETMHAVQEPAATKENTGLTLIFDWLCRASKITCVLKKGSEKSERWRPNTVNFR